MLFNVFSFELCVFFDELIEKKGLHPKELRPLLLKVGIDVPVSDLKVKMAAHDSNFDGRLSFEEFQGNNNLYF